MTPILKILQDEGLECLPCDRINLDSLRFEEYRDAEEHPAERAFENPTLGQSKKHVPNLPPTVPCILQYFLDGSRRTYKIADLILDGRFLPVVAGQVGVAVMRRDDQERTRLVPERSFCRFKNLLAFPDRTSESDLLTLSDAINKKARAKFDLVRYTNKADRDPVDLGVARIMSEMQDMEIAVVQAMARENLLRNDSLLVIDGPLRFRKNLDVVQFRNVIGLSKSFRPSFTIKKGANRQDVGAITSHLDFAERSTVFRTLEDRNVIGMWYLRIRPKCQMANPLQGTIKLECFAVEPSERENGIEVDRIDCVSAHILRQRNVTPYKTDFRWASHIYPIFLAETYLKSSFMSDTYFRGLF